MTDRQTKNTQTEMRKDGRTNNRNTHTDIQTDPTFVPKITSLFHFGYFDIVP